MFHSMCGLEDCDCGHIIRTLEEVLEDIKRRASPRSQDFLHPTKQFADDVVGMADAGIAWVIGEEDNLILEGVKQQAAWWKRWENIGKQEEGGQTGKES